MGKKLSLKMPPVSRRQKGTLICWPRHRKHIFGTSMLWTWMNAGLRPPAGCLYLNRAAKDGERTLVHG
jgi:hypothetical protein